MLFNCYWIVSTTFVCEIIGEYHYFLTINNTNTCNNIAWRYVFVKPSKLTNFKEWWTSITNSSNSVSWCVFTTFLKFFLFSYAQSHSTSNSLIKFKVQVLHRVVVRQIHIRSNINFFVQNLSKVNVVVWEVTSIQLSLKLKIKEIFTRCLISKCSRCLNQTRS